MPFDPVPVSRIATKDEFWAATPRQRLGMLSYALRHMPATHAWDFREINRSWKPEHANWCGTAGCADGLSKGLWDADVICGAASYGYNDKLHQIFSCYTTHASRHLLHGVAAEDVTPTMVADAIDRYLATGDPRP